MPSFEDYAALVGSVCISAKLSNPFAPIADWPMGGDESGRALEMAVCKLAADLIKDGELTTDEILEALREAETLGDVISWDCRDEKKALGHKLKKLRTFIFTDTRGRRFEFGRRAVASGSRYPIHFLAAAAE
jgi:hypothetical protein